MLEEYECSYMRQPRIPYQGGGAPSSPEYLEPPTCAHIVWKTTTTFCTAIYTIDHEIWSAMCSI